MSEAPDQDALEALGRALGAALLERGWRMASAESCTGGWIAQAMTATAGSSDWFECGLVTYSNAAKIALLGVDAMTLERHGAVSTETAAEMAAGALRVGGVDVAVSVTGVAGPGGGSAHKPVGTVCFGFAIEGRATVTDRQVFPGDRRAVRAHTVAHALKRLNGMLD
ncbi:MAG: CinA family protein [Gammaproteobacteria bacterium]|nr:CinA family protein [Gammaproteobacteria bacterium]